MDIRVHILWDLIADNGIGDFAENLIDALSEYAPDTKEEGDKCVAFENVIRKFQGHKLISESKHAKHGLTLEEIRQGEERFKRSGNVSDLATMDDEEID